MPRSRKTTEEKIAELEKKQAQLKARLSREKAALKTKQRKEDTRRKIVVGAIVLEHATRDARFADFLETLLNKAVQREADRTLLGLPEKRGGATIAGRDFPAANGGK